ncbi:MAG: NUDIX hydrolase [Paenarthrobacter ureafaciens]|jgi:8-oxo-dGTP pyrophosphatase MutT (NUDIX family)|uniref:NUDIX domain-containing protein n=1 Tax=Paenarthrobacter ureafaciens TaxID=37931 RepID=UPI001AD4D67B|nr:NUDIX hydrolase [Paenarthrobacter ureafaciens]MBN9131734.1 NUDIX hydrolase [Paenarthrobacter ureafaciens]
MEIDSETALDTKSREATVQHSNPYFNVERQVFTTETASNIEYWSVYKSDFAAVLALSDDDRIMLIECFRPLINRVVWEVPQGGTEQCETHQESAERELREETGLTAANWSKLATIHESYGLTSSACHLFIASNLEQLQPEPEENENLIRTGYFTCEQMEEKIRQGQVTDAITIASLTFWKLLRPTSNPSTNETELEDIYE